MTDSNEGIPWQARKEAITRLLDTSSTQRDILEQILLHYPKRIARWIATHCPERLLPNKESAGVLDALEGWNEPQPSAWTASSWTWPGSTYFSGITGIVTRKSIGLKSITKAHGNNNNSSSK